MSLDEKLQSPLTPGSCRAPCRPATSWPEWRCPPWWSGRCPPCRSWGWCSGWPGVKWRLLWCYVVCSPAQVCPALSTLSPNWSALNTLNFLLTITSLLRQEEAHLCSVCHLHQEQMRSEMGKCWYEAVTVTSDKPICQIGGLFVNIYPGRCHNSPLLSLFCYWAPTRLNSKHTEQTDVWADWLTDYRDPKRPVPALLV